LPNTRDFALMAAMPIRGSKRCPLCGKRPYDQTLEACPECRIPYAYDYEANPDAPPVRLTAEQLQAMRWQVLASWKLWAVLVIVVAAASWGVVQYANWTLDQRTGSYLSKLDEKSNTRLKQAYDRAARDISQQMSNQVASEFRSERVRSMVSQYALEHAQEAFTNFVWPSLDAFRQKLDQADAQLAASTNSLARLSKQVRDAQLQATQLATPAVASPAPVEPAHLSLVNQNVTRNGPGFLLTLVFKATTSKPMGEVELVAGTYEQTARILHFAAPGAFQSEEPVMNDYGDAARLKFTPARGEVPILVELGLTAPTIVKLTGDALEQELIVPVAANRMQLPSGSK
jgi:hypothetical protein